MDYFAERDNGRGAYEIPTTKPFYRDLFTDHDNRIWVSLYAPAQKIDLPTRPPATNARCCCGNNAPRTMCSTRRASISLESCSRLAPACWRRAAIDCGCCRKAPTTKTSFVCIRSRE